MNINYVLIDYENVQVNAYSVEKVVLLPFDCLA